MRCRRSSPSQSFVHMLLFAPMPAVRLKNAGIRFSPCSMLTIVFIHVLQYSISEEPCAPASMHVQLKRRSLAVASRQPEPLKDFLSMSGSHLSHIAHDGDRRCRRVGDRHCFVAHSKIGHLQREHAAGTPARQAVASSARCMSNS